MSLIAVAVNSCALYNEIPGLWEEYKACRSNEKLSVSGKLCILWFKMTLVACKFTEIFLHIRMLNQEKLLPANKKDIEKLQKLLIKTHLVKKISECCIKAICISREGKDPLSIKGGIWANVASTTVAAMGVYGSVSKKTVETANKLEWVVDHWENAKSAYSLATNVRHRTEVLVDAQSIFYFHYDKWFSHFQIEQIQLELKAAEIGVGYSRIPCEYRTNYVFRHFKCFITKQPVRYPVIIVNRNTGKPLQPMYLFERASLIMYLIQDKCVYPGTEHVIEFSDAREHLGVRKLIENEIRRLGIEDNQ